MSNQIARNKRNTYLGPNTNTYGFLVDDLSPTSGAPHTVAFTTLTSNKDFLDGAISLNTGTHIFTVNKAGNYVLNYDISFQASAVGDRHAYLNIGGAEYGVMHTRATATGSTQLSGTWIGWLNNGDTFSLTSVQDSGGALNNLVVYTRLSIMLTK